MLSLVEYSDASSDDEQDDIEECLQASTKIVVLEPKTKDPIHKKLILPRPKEPVVPNIKELDSDNIEGPLNLKLPKPIAQRINVPATPQEEDDEFLRKKSIPTATPPPAKLLNKVKGPVKISIPALSEFKDDPEVEKTISNHVGPAKGSSLLGILPKPRSESIMSAKQKTLETQSKSTTVAKSATFLIPDSVKKRQEAEKKKQLESKTSNLLGASYSDSDEDEETTDFFCLEKNDVLPEISTKEVNLMVAKQKASMAQRKRKIDQDLLAAAQSIQEPDLEVMPPPQNPDLDRMAVQQLIGGNKAKRAKLSEINIIDITDSDLMPNKEDFMRKQLTQQTQFVPTGNLMGYDSTSKRKSQITFLAQKAVANEQELEAMWAANRQTKRASSSKYGF